MPPCVEGAHQRVFAAGRFGEHRRHADSDLSCRLVREREGEYPLRLHGAVADQVRDASGENACLARARSGHHGCRSVTVSGGRLLLRRETGERIVRKSSPT
jgi:hypothetical protein